MPLIFSAFPMNNEEWQLKQFYNDESMKKRTLSDMAIITMGQSPDSSSYNENGSGLPFFQGNAGFGDVHPHTQIFCSSPKKTAIPGDVLISVRAPIGAVNIADQKCCIGRGLAAITPLSDSNTGFIFYFLKSKTKILQSKGTGTTFKAIGKDILGKLSFPDYPLSQQKQIAMRLDKIQELVSLQKEQIRKLEQLVKSRFLEMFGDPVSNHKEWEIKTLKDLGAVMSGGTPARSISKYFGGNINWFSAGELNSLFIDKSLETITEEGLLHSNAKLFPAGSLLIGMYDTAAFKLSILKQKAAFNQACAAISPEVVKVIWLYYVLSLLKHEALKFRRGVRQKNLNLQFIRDFKVPVPPLDLQKQFAEFVEKAETQKALLEKRLNRLETLYKSLMQQYFG